jgi:hypothetical protein
MRHLYEGHGTGRHLAAVSLCGERFIHCDPVALEKMQDPQNPICARCQETVKARLAASYGRRAVSES